MHLALRRGGLTNDLNTKMVQRMSVGATAVLMLASVDAAFIHGLHFLVPALALIVATTLPEWRDFKPKRLHRNWLTVRWFIAMVATTSLWLYQSPAAGKALLVAVFVTLLSAICRRQMKAKYWQWAISVLYALLLLIILAAFPLSPPVLFAAFGLALELALNFSLFRFLVERIGPVDRVACVPLLLIYHICCGIAVMLGLISYYFGTERKMGSTK
jgi:hypothetical protein